MVMMSDGTVQNSTEASRSFYPSMKSGGLRWKKLEGERIGDIMVMLGHCRDTLATLSRMDQIPIHHPH